MLSIKREIKDYEKAHVASRRQSHHMKKGHLPSDILDPELTFQPQVNKISVRIAKTKNAVKNLEEGERKIDFGERLHRDHKTWHKDLEALRQEKLDKELAECTFQPNRSKSKRTYRQLGMGGSSYRGVGVINDTPEHRLNKWLRKRDQKIERKMKERHDSSLNGCTFEPNAHRREQRPQKKQPGTGGPENSKHRIKWNKERRASQRQVMMKKIAEDNYNIISSPHLTGVNQGIETSPSAASGDNIQITPMKKIYQGAAETPEEARQRRRLESERRHMLRMQKAHENRRHKKASNIRNQLRDPYSVSGNTNPDWKSIGAGGFAFKSHQAKVNAQRRSSKKQSADTLEMRYEEVIKPPVSSDDYIDLHETF